jgi:uncharacterized protein
VACEDYARRDREARTVRRRLLVLALCAGATLGAYPAHAAAPATGRAAADCTGLPLHTRFPVVDSAGVVDPEPEAYLDADLLLYHAQGGEAVVEVTVTDLGGDDVSSYAKRLFDCWGVGDAKSDNGVLVLVAMTERRVRIELGAGLEGRIADQRLDAAIAGMKASLRAGDVAAALRSAAESVVADLGGTLPDTQASAVPVATKAPGDVTDSTDGSGAGLPQGYAYPRGAEPFAPDDSPGNGTTGFFLLFLLFGIGMPVVRALFRGGAIASDVWGSARPALLHAGRWQDSSPSFSSSSSSSSGSSGSSFSGGSSGPSSFGGGSSGGGGASGSW